MKFNNDTNSILFGTWLNFFKKSNVEWLEFFEKMSDAGITEYFVNATIDQLKYLIDLTKGSNVNIHGWVWILNRPNDVEASKNMNWYSVNKLKQNSYDFRAYVDYYQWLSPFSKGARNYIKNNILNISKIKEIASVHLDYIRYCDIFLPINLQKKYGLNQTFEMPEFDFGYHPNARKAFKKKYDIDPIDIKNKELFRYWNHFRLDAITSLVTELKIIAHQNKTQISAAVFPYPKMSREMVRQDWSKWELDIMCPMNYHHFYDEDINWIGKSVSKGIKDISSKSKYLSGLFVGALNPKDLKKVIIKSLKNGANGVSLFSAEGLSKDHLNVIKSFK